ncbi:hypothetical protein LCGC14_2027530 [marine sediment metagenome]|uniref:HNH nuclease domain-containing protein n=1 Tax=marine sediment metagenome TaxID=412755 RepID=A0A0F9HSR1_9ZZZZ
MATRPKPKAVPALTPEQIGRFWAKVDQQGDDDCWEWTASLLTTGYGQFKVGSRMMGAHRIVYFLNYGQPTGFFVCHHCDNRKCCNPKHLFLGTNADNMADAARKGRVKGPHFNGEENGRAKLTTQQVLAIRKSPDRQVSLAEKYGVTPVMISRIKLRKAWRHL